MRDHKELFLFGKTLPSKGCDSSLFERVVDAANNRNRYGARVTSAISGIPANDIRQIAAGCQCIAFLFSNNRIARLGFSLSSNPVLPHAATKSSSSGSAGSGNGGDPAAQSGSAFPPPTSGFGGSAPLSLGASAASSASNRSAKIRRMMIAARRPGGISGRAGVIVDRGRSMLPASAIPEELIAQAQVVLQGKSREMIVRELQRTNLNVNEAVNNLLSRDDDEVDELDDASESYLHEELLSLLDAGLRSDPSGAAVIDGEGMYNAPDGYEFLVNRDSRRREESKSKDRKADPTAPPESFQQNFTFADELEYWHDAAGEDFPENVQKFVKIGATYSCLFALADDGQLYAWNWKDELPTNKPHSVNKRLGIDPTTETITDFECCAWRVAVVTNKRRVGSFMDEYCQQALANSFFSPLMDLPTGAMPEKLMVCPLYTAVQTTANRLLWWGAYPFTDRGQLLESSKKKGRDDSGKSKDIVVGAEVCTRSVPMYASGSVGVNFSAMGVPLIGILMESAWTLSETCRFRVYEPAEYALYLQQNPHLIPSSEGSLTDLNVRKRAAPSDEGPAPASASSGPAARYKEDAWNLGNVTFFHEAPVCDTAIVKIVDGSIAGVVYRSAIEKSERENNGVADEVHLFKNSLRLIHKDELMVVPNVKLSRSPPTFQKKPLEVKLSRSVRRILAACVDNDHLQILVEKVSGETVLLTVNGLATDITERFLPVDSEVLAGLGSPSMENYGDGGWAVLRDSTGNIVPLFPDFYHGFREPRHLGLGAITHFSMGMRFVNNNVVNPNSPPTTANVISSTFTRDPAIAKNHEDAKNINRVLLMCALITPEPRTTDPKIDSLIQNIQYCQLDNVRRILRELSDSADDEERRFQILQSRTDGNRNILHTAVMNAIAVANKEQADDYKNVKTDDAGKVTTDPVPSVLPPKGSSSKSRRSASSSATSSAVATTAPERLDTAEADAVSQKFDQRWREMISSTTEAAIKAAAGIESGTAASSTGSTSKSPEDKSREATPKKEAPPREEIPQSPKQRQQNSIQILAELISAEVVKPFLVELMQQRDILGHTPFYCAVQTRAYTAGLLLWRRIYALQKAENAATPEQLSKFAMSGIVNDPTIFVLCCNDTCSFTWTGEEHINQDIFECKTCDLVGSLCCCSECAYTCHRDHECRLKRTSPTAYCDCWEKCSCKALVAGNQRQRENLLNALLHETNLIESLNFRGEHVMMFLARVVGRQLVEQENYPRRIGSKARSSNAAAASAAAATAGETTTQPMPEHDLEPPRFATSALLQLLGSWKAVRSLLRTGFKEHNTEVPVTEDLFQLNSQSGASHLDRFVFTLLARCQETHLDALLNTLVREANRPNDQRDPDTNILIGRFVRSVVRLFTFLCISSQSAMNTTLAATAIALSAALDASKDNRRYQLSSAAPASSSSSAPHKVLLPNYRAITVSGVLSLVRTSLPMVSSSSAKETKKQMVNDFVLKCRRSFQVLVTYSITELLNAAESLMAPIRVGVVKQGITMHKNIGSAEVLDMMEKYLNNEPDYTTALLRGTIDFKRRHRRNRSSNDAPRNNRRRRESNGSDSDDSDHPPARRRSVAFSDVPPQNAEDLARQFNETFANPDASNDNRSRNRGLGAAMSAFYEYSSEDDEDNGDDDNDDDDDESDGDEDGVHDEANLDDTAEDDEVDDHYIDDDEEDHFFRIDDDAVDGSGEDFTEDERYYSSDGEHHHDEAAEPHDEMNVEAVANANVEEPQPMDAAPAVADENAENAENVEAGSARVEPLHPSNIRTNRRRARRSRNRSSRHNSENAAQASDATVQADNSQQADAANFVFSLEEANPNNDTVATEEANNDENVDNEPRYAFRLGSRAISVPGREGAAATSGASYSPHSPSIAWAIHRRRVANNTDPANTENNNSGGRDSNGNAPTSSSNGNAATTTATQPPPATSPRKTHRRAPENEVYQTNLQLAAAYSLLVKLIDELTLRLAQHDQYSQNLQGPIRSLLTFNNNHSIALAFRNLIDERTQPAWEWFGRVMDSLESMLRYGNALLKSQIGPEIDGRSPRDRRSQRKSDEPSRRNDFFDYFMSLMRTQSAEAADAMPHIDPGPIRHVSLAAETYLFHLNIGELIDQKLGSFQATPAASATPSPQRQLHDSASEAALCHVELSRFYRRSNSISYPFMSATHAHNAFKYAVSESLPLALKSSLLTPEAEKAELFMLPIPERTVEEHLQMARDHGLHNPAHHSLATSPVRVDDIVYHCDVKTEPVDEDDAADEAMHVDHTPVLRAEDTKPIDGEESDVATLLGIRISAKKAALQHAFGRWGLSMVYMAKAFHDDIIEFVGADSFNSILLNEVGGFPLKHSQFKARMEKYRGKLTKDFNFSQLPREKHSLLTEVFQYLNNQSSRRASSTNLDPNAPQLGVNRVKATFRDEPGEGSGVVRSFYAAFADAITEMSYLPMAEGIANVDTTLPVGSAPSGSASTNAIPTDNTSPRAAAPRASSAGSLGVLADGRRSADPSGGLNAVALALPERGVRTRAQQRAAAAAASTTSTASGSSPSSTSSKKPMESLPLFFKSSKTGFLTPTPTFASSARENAFRNVGRMIGLCLEQMEILPIKLCRHVVKYILGRPITWFDLAFYDASIFDSLRSIAFNDTKGQPHDDDFYDALGLNFIIDVASEEGGGLMELKPGGSNIPVTRQNVLEYIYLLVQKKLLGEHLRALDAIKEGVFDVIPVDTLSGLTAEELRLILCGPEEVSIEVLESFTTWLDESSSPPDFITKYKQWFYEVLYKMTDQEKQDLVFFWTGSPSLPSTEEAFTPLPTVMLRPADDQHLPTANTCISRLYLPIYSSKRLLRKKMLTAIQARDFGFV